LQDLFHDHPEVCHPHAVVGKVTVIKLLRYVISYFFK
jgi:hypothetical protein